MPENPRNGNITYFRNIILMYKRLCYQLLDLTFTLNQHLHNVIENKHNQQTEYVVLQNVAGQGIIE